MVQTDLVQISSHPEEAYDIGQLNFLERKFPWSVQNTVYGNSHPSFFPGKHNLCSHGISHVKKTIGCKTACCWLWWGCWFCFLPCTDRKLKKKKETSNTPKVKAIYIWKVVQVIKPVLFINISFALFILLLKT